MNKAKLAVRTWAVFMIGIFVLIGVTSYVLLEKEYSEPPSSFVQNFTTAKVITSSLGSVESIGDKDVFG